MKMNFKLLLFLLFQAIITTSCSTTYYTGETVEDTYMYSSPNPNSGVQFVIPARSKVIIRKKNRFYHYLVYESNDGYVYLPRLANYHKFDSKIDGQLYGFYTYKKRVVRNPIALPLVRVSSGGNTSSGLNSGRRVNVRGYTRKDGTHVQPHTRSAPSRKH